MKTARFGADRWAPVWSGMNRAVSRVIVRWDKMHYGDTALAALGMGVSRGSWLQRFPARDKRAEPHLKPYPQEIARSRSICEVERSSDAGKH